MPYITITTTLALDKEKQSFLAKEIDSKVPLIEGKSTGQLMVTFNTQKTIFFKGEELKNGAFIDVRMFKTREAKEYKAFTEALFDVMKSHLYISELDMYINIIDLDSWGTKGTLKYIE